MTKRFPCGFVLCLLFFVFSTCNQRAPTTPRSPITPQVTYVENITVLSTKAMYFIGETETFTASLTMSDGSTVQITDGTWSSDTQNIATVNNAGLVTIAGEGWANITCTYQGKTGSKQILGMGDYRGIWSGTYSIVECSSSGDFVAAGFCDTHGGSGYPIELDLTQGGDVLQGTINLGSLSTTVIGLPLLDGTLELEGRIYSDPYVLNIFIGCQWKESGPSFGPMMQYYEANGMTGRAELRCNISSINKTSAKAGASVIAGKE